MIENAVLFLKLDIFQILLLEIINVQYMHRNFLNYFEFNSLIVIYLRSTPFL